jgi:hypothetical protein
MKVCDAGGRREGRHQFLEFKDEVQFASGGAAWKKAIRLPEMFDAGSSVTVDLRSIACRRVSETGRQLAAASRQDPSRKRNWPPCERTLLRRDLPLKLHGRRTKGMAASDHPLDTVAEPDS